jgi:hypothetical protein
MHDIFPVGFIKKQNFILEDEYRLNKFDFADKGYSLPSSVFKEIILGYKLFEKGNDILRDEILELIQNKFSAANISVAQKDTLNNVIIKKI